MQNIIELQLFLENNCLNAKEKMILLKNDDRLDESNFEKIRFNTFEIFLTMLKVGIKKGSTEQAGYEFFLKKLDELPKVWNESLNAAVKHENIEKQYIENVKLEVVAKIKNFLQLH